MLFIKSGKDSSMTDAEIISAYRSTRNSGFIGILFERYSHLVFAVSMKYLKNEEDSKDTVIQIFEKLPNDLIKYEIQNFSSWLHSVTKNYCIRFLSKKKYTVETDNLPDQIEEDEDIFVKQYLPHLDKAIAELNREQQICIEFFYIQNMSYQEVSDKTKFSLNEVKSYIQNGKRNLKIILLKKADDN